MAFVSSLAYAFLSAASCIDPLWVERVTQTWLMSPYWLWLLWQLLIRDWLGTVAICWGGWKETLCLHLVELSSKPTHGSVKRLLYLALKVLWNNIEKIKDVLYYYKGSPAVDLLKQRGDLSWSRAPHHCSAVLTLGFCSVHTIHSLCMIIKLSLRGCCLMGFCAGMRTAWEQRNKRWRGQEDSFAERLLNITDK